MQKYIENLVKGYFEYETDKLEISEKKIEAEVTPGEDYDGSFVISSRSDRNIGFSVLTSDLRIRVSVKEYEGRTDEGVTIEYSISSRGLDSGYVFKGEIFVISDLGEVTLPIVLEVKRQYIESSVGPIKNLFHFTNLARSDFDEAVNVFYMPEFKDIFLNTERQWLLKYRGFLNGRKCSENVEEFLISINKKSPVVYSFVDENISLLDVYDDEPGMFEVRKSGWGYTHFTLDTDSDFVEFPKKEFNTYDFIGSSLKIEYLIRADRLHEGINFGSVMLHSSHSDILLPVFVNNGSMKRPDIDRDIRFKKMLASLTECYISFRIKDITSYAWINKSQETVERMLHMNKERLDVRLYQVHSLLIAGRDREANILLKKVEEEFDVNNADANLKGYYLYLKAFNSEDEDELKKAVQTVWELYESHRESDRLLWILLYLDESIKLSPLRERELILRQLERGSRSPMLFIEAYSLFSKEPELLTQLDTIEIKVLLFAVKHGLYRKSLAERVTLLSSRSRGYNELLFKVLARYFDEFSDDETLTAICSYLIRNEKSEKRFAPYFKAAVDRELKITNLYEYFLYTLPDNATELLPKNVLIYFSLENNLPAPLKSYVFANMIVHENDTAPLLEASRERMVEFAVGEIQKNRIDENLAIIYDYLGYFKDSDFGQMRQRSSVDAALTEVAFIRLIKCRDKRAHYCVVVEGQLKEEKKYLLKGGAAYIKVCGAEYEIFFENENGERFSRLESGYEEIPLLHTQSAVRQIDCIAQDDLSLTVYLSSRGRNGFGVDSNNFVFVRRAMESAEVTEEYKSEVRMDLLRFYFDEDMTDELDSLISILDTSILRMDERSDLLRYMVLRDMFNKAYEMVGRFGVSGTDPKTMVKLLTTLLPASVNEPINELICMSWYVFFEGKYNDLVLAYLINHYDGTTRNLRKIWRAGEDFDLDVRLIEEKIVMQMLRTGSFIGEKDDIFFDYVKRGAASDIAYAYLSNSAYGYFVKERITDDRIFTELLNTFEDKGALNDVCMLSLIRYYSDKDRDERTEKIIHGCIRGCLEKNIIFGFFNEFRDEVEELKLYADLSFVEYRTNPKNRVVLHYILNDGSDGKVNYTKEEMSNVYGGIFSKKFVLFEGERLQYYITEESGGQENLTISGVVERELDVQNSQLTRYDMLNEIILCMGLEDYGSMQDALEGYIVKKSVADAILGGSKSG